MDDLHKEVARMAFKSFANGEAIEGSIDYQFRHIDNRRAGALIRVRVNDDDDTRDFVVKVIEVI